MLFLWIATLKIEVDWLKSLHKGQISWTVHLSKEILKRGAGGSVPKCGFCHFWGIPLGHVLFSVSVIAFHQQTFLVLSSAWEKIWLFLGFRSEPSIEFLWRRGRISAHLSKQPNSHLVSFTFSLPGTCTRPACPVQVVAAESEHWRRLLFCFTSHFICSPKHKSLHSLRCSIVACKAAVM